MTQGHIRRSSVCSLFESESNSKSEIIKEADDDICKTQHDIKKVFISISCLLIFNVINDNRYMLLKQN